MLPVGAMRQKIVGVYELGYEQVQLVIREGTGGEFWFLPETGKVPRMKIGADAEWKAVVAALLHESFELAMCRKGVRWLPDPNLGNDHASYLFVLTHPQFSDACAMASEYLVASLPDLAKAWRKWKKKKQAV